MNVNFFDLLKKHSEKGQRKGTCQNGVGPGWHLQFQGLGISAVKTPRLNFLNSGLRKQGLEEQKKRAPCTRQRETSKRRSLDSHTGQLLVVHSKTRGLHRHLEDSDTPIVWGQDHFIWRAPVHVQYPKGHVSPASYTAHHLNLQERTWWSLSERKGRCASFWVTVKEGRCLWQRPKASSKLESIFGAFKCSVHVKDSSNIVKNVLSCHPWNRNTIKNFSEGQSHSKSDGPITQFSRVKWKGAAPLTANTRGAGPTSFVSHTSAPSLYIAINFWFPLPGAKRIFLTQLRCVGIPLRTSKQNRDTSMKKGKLSSPETMSHVSISIFDKLWWRGNRFTLWDWGHIWHRVCPLTAAGITSQCFCMGHLQIWVTQSSDGGPGPSSQVQW